MSSNTEGRKTIIIDRKTPAKFFQSEYSEIQGGGNIRRSIPNIKQVEAALFEYHPSMVCMEGQSLKRQATIFHTADIIIAQHGAALSN
jgi:capsular polysaccharide biosynthesis protein